MGFYQTALSSSSVLRVFIPMKRHTNDTFLQKFKRKLARGEDVSLSQILQHQGTKWAFCQPENKNMKSFVLQFLFLERRVKQHIQGLPAQLEATLCLLLVKKQKKDLTSSSLRFILGSLSKNNEEKKSCQVGPCFAFRAALVLYGI